MVAPLRPPASGEPTHDTNDTATDTFTFSGPPPSERTMAGYSNGQQLQQLGTDLPAAHLGPIPPAHAVPPPTRHTATMPYNPITGSGPAPSERTYAGFSDGQSLHRPGTDLPDARFGHLPPTHTLPAQTTTPHRHTASTTSQLQRTSSIRAHGSRVLGWSAASPTWIRSS